MWAGTRDVRRAGTRALLRAAGGSIGAVPVRMALLLPPCCCLCCAALWRGHLGVGRPLCVCVLTCDAWVRGSARLEKRRARRHSRVREGAHEMKVSCHVWAAMSGVLPCGGSRGWARERRGTGGDGSLSVSFDSHVAGVRARSRRALFALRRGPRIQSRWFARRPRRRVTDAKRCARGQGREGRRRGLCDLAFDTVREGGK